MTPRKTTLFVLLFAAFVLPLSRAGAAPISAISVKPDDVDLANSRLVQGSASSPATPEMIKDMLSSPVIGNHGWLTPRPASEDNATPKHYIIAFKTPQPIGSIAFTGSPTVLKYLKPNQPASSAPDNAAAWQGVEIPRNHGGASLVTLAPETITQALLFTDLAPQYPNRLQGLRITRARLYNLTPSAVPFADSEYIGFHSGAPPSYCLASHITTGELPPWQNTGTDSKGVFRRPPVSDYAPSWVILAWRTPQPISALWMADNFTQFNVEYFVGPDSLNPRAGTEMDWKTIEGLTKVPGYGRTVEFPKTITTRGIRINILATASNEAQIARLMGIHALTDLKDQPLPKDASAGEITAPPVSIPYSFDFDGTATMVVNTPDGRRVRNIFARRPLAKGTQTAGWDLKDEVGNVVQPGTYRWTALAAPPLGLKYEMTCYPNVNENSPMNAPWLTGQAGPGGWLADHSSPRSATTSGDMVFFGAPVSESGVSFIACDLTGRKLWAIGSFGPWAGSYIMAADDKTVFTECFDVKLPDASKVDTLFDKVYAVDIKTHEFRELASFRPTANRKRGAQWMATANGKLYISVNAPTDWLVSSASQADADIDNCHPRYPAKRKERFANEDVPDPRSDFMALFRLAPLPPRSKWLEYIESLPGKSARHHVMMAFRKPVAIGTVVLPRATYPGVNIKLSALKPDAPYPPNAGDPKQWIPFETQPSAAWDAAIAPKNCITRALRVSFIKGDEDPLSEADDSAEYSRNPAGEKPRALGGGKDDALGLDDASWKGQVEGLKMIGRRFANIAPKAKVLVNSGNINKEGEWDAQRTKPLSDADPGIYAMEWPKPQTVRGLAFKEVDGARTEIDIYTGPDTAKIDISAKENWTHLKSYIQQRRTHYINRTSDNCRYMDGYVDFGKDVTTRAIRLRVVEQWSDFAGEEALRWDLKDKLDSRRCRIFGVAALQYVGGEPAESNDPLTYHRIEVLDSVTGKVTTELALPNAGPIATNSAGDLFATSGGDVVKVNTNGGEHTPIVKGDLLDPQAMAIDKAGNFYIYDHAPDRRTIRVYSPDGKLTRQIGTPGGYRVGAWDPTRLENISALTIDKNDQLWAVDTTFPYPKRIARFALDGTFKADYLGNTPYGGGGVLDQFDKRRLFFGPMEFALDWDTGKTRLKNITWLGDTPPGEFPIVIENRLYLTTRYGNDKVSDKVAIVYRYDKDHSVLAAAMGKADYFPPLARNGIPAALGIKSLREIDFLWSDLNGDGEVQADEVTIHPRTTGNLYSGDIFTNFNLDLGIQFGKRRYEVAKFLPSGVPIYQIKTIPNLKGYTFFKMNDGNFHTMGRHSNEMVMTPQGKPVWTYPAEGWTVEGTVEQKPYTPEQVVGQYYMAGHGTTHAGDLGEFFAFHTNMGNWNLWTGDGMLAASIFKDQRLDGVGQWHMNEHQRGLRLDNITIGQEHFSAWLCRTSDNHYYAVAGHNHISVVEILGMDKFKRQSGNITVTPQDIAKTSEWDARQAKQQAVEHTAVLDCFRTKVPPTIDGITRDWDAEPSSSRIGEYMGERIHGGSLRTAYDDKTLYLCYEIIGMGPMKNTGEQWDRLFKTGAAVDLQIGVDPQASPSRNTPAAGDKRLLITFTGREQKPTVVLYDAVIPGTSPDAAWKAVSPVGHVEFDRVRKIETAQVALATRGENYYVVEAAIPLAELNLKPAENMRLKLDWGILVTDNDGNAVTRRTYWSNQATGVVADVPSEARLHPDLWGYVLFHEKGFGGVASQPTRPDLPEKTIGKIDTATDKLLSDFEKDLKDEQKGKK